MIDDLREDGIDPAYIDVESWYEFPQYLVPETKENSFTNIILDVGKKFLLSGKLEISSEGGVYEITGYGETLQLYAKDISTGSDVEVDWIVSDANVAAVNATGLLTTIKWGTVTVTATAKDGSGQFAEFSLRVFDPDEPTAIIIKSEGDVTEINGFGSTLQFYAEDEGNGNLAEVSWSVDNGRAASINENGLLTTIKSGNINVVAILKSNPDVVKSFQLTITNNSTIINVSSYFYGVNIFPNPASRNLNIEVLENMSDISVKIEVLQ